MKRYFIFGVLVGLLFIVGCTSQQPAPQSRPTPNVIPHVQPPPVAEPATTHVPPTSEAPETYTMDIKDFSFSKRTITVHVGDAITWTNKDSAPHTVTSNSGNELDSGQLSQGQSYSHTFTQAGTYAYHCAVHPSMTATVVVE